jgi:hypothetical protein
VIEARNVKGRPKSESKGGNRYYQDGLDDTPADGRFVITIKYPKNPAALETFRQQLSAAAANTASATATLTIPVEDVQSGYAPPTDEQIKIDW